MPEHSTLTGSDLHEPKGADTANSGEVYVADGAGSGSWTAREDVLTLHFSNIASVTSAWVVSPVGGTITEIKSVLHDAITADTTLTAKIGGVAVTGGVILIATAGSAAGTVDSCSPTAGNTVTAGQAIEIASDGATAGTHEVTLSITIQRDA